jgi:hypothetical protein
VRLTALWARIDPPHACMACFEVPVAGASCKKVSCNVLLAPQV